MLLLIPVPSSHLEVVFLFNCVFGGKFWKSREVHKQATRTKSSSASAAAVYHSNCCAFFWRFNLSESVTTSTQTTPPNFPKCRVDFLMPTRFNLPTLPRLHRRPQPPPHHTCLDEEFDHAHHPEPNVLPVLPRKHFVSQVKKAASTTDG